MKYTEKDLKKAYELGVNDGVNYCGYNTMVMKVIASEKRKEFMKEYPRPKFKELEEIVKLIEKV